MALYAAIGFTVGGAFVAVGIDRALVPPAEVSLGARVLIFPGAAALWPYVLKRWVGRSHAP
jgi:hypothetical protein